MAENNILISTHNPVTGPRHLGHYFGAMKSLVECQHDYETIVVLDDLPSIIKYAKTGLSPNKAQFRCLKGNKIEASSAPYSGKYFVFPDIWPPSHIPPAYCNGQCSLLTNLI